MPSPQTRKEHMTRYRLLDADGIQCDIVNTAEEVGNFVIAMKRENLDYSIEIIDDIADLPAPHRQIVNDVIAECWRNVENSDVHTVEDVAADVVRKLSHDYLGEENV